MPQFSDNVHTTSFYLGSLRILGFIDHVFVHIFGHHPAGIVVHPSGNESGQIQSGISIHHRFIVYQLISHLSRHRGFRHFKLRSYTGFFRCSENWSVWIFCFHNNKVKLL